MSTTQTLTELLFGGNISQQLFGTKYEKSCAMIRLGTIAVLLLITLLTIILIWLTSVPAMTKFLISGAFFAGAIVISIIINKVYLVTLTECATSNLSREHALAGK